jgi:hypothetical protein
METKCPRCQQKAFENGVCGACGFCEQDGPGFEDGPWAEGWKERCGGYEIPNSKYFKKPKNVLHYKGRPIEKLSKSELIEALNVTYDLLEAERNRHNKNL